MSTETPANVATSAAIPAALPLDRLTVLGLFTNKDGGSALIRSPDGDIAQVSAGGNAFGVQIAAIDETAVVVIDAAGTEHRLTIPG